MKRLYVGLIVPVLIAGVGVASYVLGPELKKRTRPPSHSAVINAPIIGRITTLQSAAAKVQYPLLVLAAEMLVDPCSGASQPVQLGQVYVSRSATAQENRQAGMIYSHGIWVSVTPLNMFHYGNVSELPPVEQAFDPLDFPTGLHNGTVRGHTAWVKELSPSFSCADHSGEYSASQPNPERTPIPEHFKLYNDGTSASIKWLENGAVFHLTGPFTADKLKQIAGAMLTY